MIAGYVFLALTVYGAWSLSRAPWLVRALARFWVHVGRGFDHLRHRSTAGLPPGFRQVNARAPGVPPFALNMRLVDRLPRVPSGPAPGARARTRDEVRMAQACPCLHLPDGNEYHTLACTDRAHWGQ